MAKVALVLAPEFADWEFGLISGVGGSFYGLDVQFFADQPGDLRSQGGLVASVAQDMADLVRWQPDAIAICGGLVWEGAEAPDIGETLTAERERGCLLAGICGGTLALARAGLLDGVQHTSNDAAFLSRNAKTYRGGQHYRHSASAVSAGGIITAPGTAPASFAAAIFERVGIDVQTLTQFRTMMAAEHQ